MSQAQLCIDGEAHAFLATCARNEATDRGVYQVVDDVYFFIFGFK